MKKIMIMKIKNMLNADQFIYEGETNHQPSMTIPDQTLPLKELISRFTRGLPITEFKPIYDENGDLPDPRKMDLVELHEMRKAAALEIQSINEKFRIEEDEKRKNAELEAFNKRVEDEIALRAKSSTSANQA